LRTVESYTYRLLVVFGGLSMYASVNSETEFLHIKVHDYPDDTICADVYGFCVVDSDKGNEADDSCLEESTGIFDGVWFVSRAICGHGIWFSSCQEILCWTC